MPRKRPTGHTGRKPVDRLARAPKPAGRQVLWDRIRDRVVFTAAELVRDTDVPSRTVRDYVHALQAAGIVDAFAGVDEGITFRLRSEPARQHGAEAPRVGREGRPVTQGLAAEQMWRTMKRLGAPFTAAGLAEAASTEQVPVRLVYAQDYCLNLARAGYLRGTQVRYGAPTVFRFLPTKDTGPLAPMIQRTTRVWDPNLNRVTWSPDQPQTDGPVAGEQVPA